MFKRNNVRNQVMAVIAQRINEEQEACDKEVALLKIEKKQAIASAFEELFSAVERAVSMFKVRKAEAESRHVNSILSKVL